MSEQPTIEHPLAKLIASFMRRRKPLPPVAPLLRRAEKELNRMAAAEASNERSMRLLAMLAADEPLFFNPLLVAEAKQIRDEVLVKYDKRKEELRKEIDSAGDTTPPARTDECPFCHATVRVRKDGKRPIHMKELRPGMSICKGSNTNAAVED